MRPASNGRCWARIYEPHPAPSPPPPSSRGETRPGVALHRPRLRSPSEGWTTTPRRPRRGEDAMDCQPGQRVQVRADALRPPDVEMSGDGSLDATVVGVDGRTGAVTVRLDELR